MRPVARGACDTRATIYPRAIKISNRDPEQARQKAHKQAVYKSGTGTRGREHRDACVGTWDLETRDGGLEDIKYGTQGRVGRGRGDVKNREAGGRGM